jgi:HlyD family secretion protein
MKKRIIGIVVVILIVVAAVFVWQVYFKEKGDEGVLLLSGNMEVTEVNVGFKLAGRIVDLPVEEGQMVKTGDLLARLDKGELETILAQNQAGVGEAMSRLALLKAGSRPQEIEQAQAQLRTQDAELNRLKKEFERAELLYKNGAISASQHDAAKSAYEARAAQQRNAAETLNLVKEGPRKEDIRSAEFRVQQMKAAVMTAQERLKDTEIHAPVAGIILKKNAELGETIGQGVPVYTIGDLANPWIKVYVSEEKLGLVKLGQKARITADTYKDKAYDGVVTYISSEAEFTPKNVQTREERVKLVYGIKVRVENPNQELKPSMPADVRIAVK